MVLPDCFSGDVGLHIEGLTMLQHPALSVECHADPGPKHVTMHHCSPETELKLDTHHAQTHLWDSD